MKNIIKYSAGVLGLVALLASSTTLAAPGDWRVMIREVDDSVDVIMPVPSRATSSYSVLGGRINEYGPSHYYLGQGFNISNAGSLYAPYNADNYQVFVELGTYSIFDLADSDVILNGKVSTTTYQGGINSLQDQINNINSPFNWFLEILYNNIHSTSTTYHLGVGTSTVGFMSLSDKNKLDSLSTSTFSGSYLDLTNKPTIPTITAQPNIADAATNASTTAATNGATNAATNLTSDSVAILGINVPTNASYVSLVSAHNDLATKYNALAVKYNDAATKYNDAATKYNDASAKLNAIIDALEANGILTP